MGQRTAVCVDCRKMFKLVTASRERRCAYCKAPRTRVQYLTCRSCDRLWVRPAQARRPPMQCMDCRPAVNLVESPDRAGRKRCCRCKAVKPRSEFHRQKRRPDGLNAACMECVRVQPRRLVCARCSSHFQYVPTVGRRLPDKNAMCEDCKRTHKCCTRCRSIKSVESFSRAADKRDGRAAHCVECAAEKYQLRPADVKLQDSIRKFNLTVSQFKAMLKKQCGACAICRTPQEECQRGYLMVDHDHACCPADRSCGRCVRGLLCGPCNFAIGLMRDDPERMTRAASYVRGAT